MFYFYSNKIVQNFNIGHNMKIIMKLSHKYQPKFKFGASPDMMAILTFVKLG